MAYVTLDQLAERFGERMLIQLTDRAAPPLGVIDTSVVDLAITDTEAVIDGYLAGRYILPLSEVPPLLTDLAKAIVIYKLHSFAPDPKIEKDYDDAKRLLLQISLGQVRLPADGIEPAGSSSSGVRTNDRPRPFTADNLKGFV